jgi:hypothetical protein
MYQKIKKFRLPRKTKKKLKNRWYTYPKSERNTYLLAWPYRIEKDYVAYKQKRIIKEY